MIHVTVEESGEILGEMRIEALGPGSRHSSKDYTVEFAADSGGGIVDLKRRVLYSFPDKYNTLALVGAALDLLDYDEMEMDDAGANAHRGETRMDSGDRGRRGLRGLPGISDL